MDDWKVASLGSIDLFCLCSQLLIEYKYQSMCSVNGLDNLMEGTEIKFQGKGEKAESQISSDTRDQHYISEFLLAVGNTTCCISTKFEEYNLDSTLSCSGNCTENFSAVINHF